MKCSVRHSAQFKKDVKQLQRGGKDMEKLLLIYAVEDNELILYRTGTHSELFR